MATDFAPIDVELRSGKRVTLRAARESDVQGILAAWQHLSAESRYTRFMSPVRDLPAEKVAHALHVDPSREFQLVAAHSAGGDEEIVGGARYVAAPGSRDCEFAITVLDDWQGQGLARALLKALIGTARARGFEHMDGFILASNAPMLGLARTLGFAPIQSPEGPAVKLLRCDLRSA